MTQWHTEDRWFQPWWRHFTQALHKRYEAWDLGDQQPKAPLVCVTQGYNEKRVPLVWVRKQPAKFWWRYATFAMEVIVRVDADHDADEDRLVTMVRQSITLPYHDSVEGSSAMFYEQTAGSKMSDSRWKETRLVYDVRVTFPRGLGSWLSDKEGNPLLSQMADSSSEGLLDKSFDVSSHHSLLPQRPRASSMDVNQEDPSAPHELQDRGAESSSPLV